MGLTGLMVTIGEQIGYSGDPNTGYSNNGNIWITDFTITDSPCLINYQGSEYRTNCPVFRCPITVAIQMVIWIPDNLSAIQTMAWKFDDRTGFNHSNTGLVRYSDPHCNLKGWFSTCWKWPCFVFKCGKECYRVTRIIIRIRDRWKAFLLRLQSYVITNFNGIT